MRLDPRGAAISVGLVVTSLVLGACSEPADVVASQSDPSSSSQVTATSSGDGSVAADPRMLFAGVAPGVYESFLAYASFDEVVDATAATVIVALAGYELNPGYVEGMEHTAEPGIYVPGYAGPSGVFRLYFRVESIVGGRAPTVVEAPEREGSSEIAVDIDYWMPVAQQAEHRAALDALVESGQRFLLLLRGGATRVGEVGVSTGAYRLWIPPFGVYAENTSDGRLARVEPDTELVTREARARGDARGEETIGRDVEPHGEDIEDPGVLPTEPVIGSQDAVFGAPSGLTIDEFLSRFARADDVRPTLAAPGHTVLG